MKEIKLGNSTLTVKVDDADFEWLSRFNWWVKEVRDDRNTVYAKGKPHGCAVLMHRFIMGADVGQQVDHIDHDGLNNQRSNLRLATPSQNKQNQDLRVDNTSGFKGVWQRPNGTWSAEVVADGERTYAGTFATAREAALAYDAHALSVHGAFAVLNLPKEVRPEADAHLPQQANSKKLSCPRGHPYDEENTLVRVDAGGSVSRSCRACHREKERERYRSGATTSADTRLDGRGSFCKRGHPFEGENLITKTNKKTGKTQRVCRACKNMMARRRKEEEAQTDYQVGAIM